MAAGGGIGSFKKRVLTITATGASTAKTIGLGGPKYARVTGFRARITSGSDTTTTLTFADKSGTVFFTGASTDYTTAKNSVIAINSTGSGSGGWSAVDSTGAGMGASGVESADVPVIEGPITVTWASATAGEVIRIDFALEV